jgi:hypothetical protein
MESYEFVIKRVLVTISKLITFLEGYLKEKENNEKIAKIINLLQDIKNIANE